MLNLPQSGYSERSDSQTSPRWTRKNESTKERRGGLNYFTLVIITIISQYFTI